jgi:selenocysteine lyase/cysteine desulfurase
MAQARTARRYRDEIKHDRKKLAIVEAANYIRNARNECKKLRTPVGNPPRGLNKQNVIDAIRDCIEKARENAHRFQSESIDAVLKKAHDQALEYVSAQDDPLQCGIGDNMYETLDTLVRHLAELQDTEL